MWFDEEISSPLVYVGGGRSATEERKTKLVDTHKPTLIIPGPHCFRNEYEILNLLRLALDPPKDECYANASHCYPQVIFITTSGEGPKSIEESLFGLPPSHHLLVAVECRSNPYTWMSVLNRTRERCM